MTSTRGGDAPVAGARVARAPGGPGPTSEAARHLAPGLIHADGTHQGDDRRVRARVSLVEADHVAAGQSGHGLARPVDRPGVGMRGKDQTPQGATRDALRALLGALDGRLDLLDLAGHLRGGKGRGQEHVGQEIQPQRQVLPEDVDRHRRARHGPRRRRGGRPTNSMAASICAAVRVAVPARQERCREIGEAPLVGGVEGGAGPLHVDPGGHDGNSGTLGHEEDEAVGQDLTVGQRRGLPGAWSRGEHGQQGPEADHRRGERPTRRPRVPLPHGTTIHQRLGRRMPTFLRSPGK